MSGSLRQEVYAYIKRKYKAAPEYLWARFPDYAVFRHSDNRKWFCLIMDIALEKLSPALKGTGDILNVKLDDPLYRDMLTGQEGYFTGYHISRGCWLSVLLDGIVPLEEIKGLIDLSFTVTASKQKRQETRPPKEWLVPSNPKYYDILHAFDSTDTIDWKQGAGIRKGDTVYLYVGAPVSAVLYKCLVTETDIPYDYSSGRLTIKSLMKIRLQKRYPPEAFTFSRLGTEFGIFAVRGPRGIPGSLSRALSRKG